MPGRHPHRSSWQPQGFCPSNPNRSPQIYRSGDNVPSIQNEDLKLLFQWFFLRLKLECRGKVYGLFFLSPQPV